MSTEKTPAPKGRLHERNKHRPRYDLEALTTRVPELRTYLVTNRHGKPSIDFAEPRAVRLLNMALLHEHYGIGQWEFPMDNLTPPVPGRVDYLHHLADLLAESNQGALPDGDRLTGLDIGTGASCIYPLLGVAEYGWQFLASDTEEASLVSARQIVEANPVLHGRIELRRQENFEKMFNGVLLPDERVDFTVCNPPFHATPEEAAAGSRRKVKNLTGKPEPEPTLNFSGQPGELVYPGGEYRFIRNMIWESREVAKQCFLFSTLVSKQSHLKRIRKLLSSVDAEQHRVIPMGTGNKSTRIVAWSFLNKKERQRWRGSRWIG